MKPQNLTHILIGIACFGLLPQIQAVSPTPDGCYPNFTTAEGCNALNLLTTGLGNTGLGWRALFSAGAANFNTAVGVGALALNTGDNNTAVGAAALLSNTTGTDNTAVGTDALQLTTTGGDNTAVGSSALFSNVGGNRNVGIGEDSLINNESGGDNTAVGSSALFSNVGGNRNVGIGKDSLTNNQSGGDNTAVGFDTGGNIVNGAGNIYIGSGVAGSGDEAAVIRIGTPDFNGAPYDTFVSGIYGRPVGPAPLAVMCGSDGKLTANASSRRFKHDIKPIDKASEAILALKPVTFLYNEDPTNTPWFGLIAEDVAEVNPDLIVRDKEGKPFGVRYEQVNAMLLNEFLKEHKKVEEQQATITQLKKDFGATIAQLTGRLDKQASQIQKVCAQLEASKPAPQTVANNQ